MATSTPTRRTPRIIDATPTVSGLDSVSDERARIPDSLTGEPHEGDLDDPAWVHPGRGVDHDRPGAGRDGQQVVDVQLPDASDAHVGREARLQVGECGDGCAVVTSVGIPTGQHLDEDRHDHLARPVDR